MARAEGRPQILVDAAPGLEHAWHEALHACGIIVIRRAELRPEQPFLVAEVFTGKAGEITPIADTIRSFEEICDGKWDHLPESAFMYVGVIEEAEEQARKQAAGSK